MAVEYEVKFENGRMIIAQTGGGIPANAGQRNGASASVISSKQLGPSYAYGSDGFTSNGIGRGGVGNETTGPGGVGNESTGPGGVGNETTGPGGVGNETTGPGGVPPQLLSHQPGSAAQFQMETQQESEWCWAAVSASVDHYFKPGSYLRQCDIASQVIQDDCCENPDQFDEPEMLQDALGAIERLAATTGRLSFEQVQSEIDARRPVCIRIAWDGGGAHFVALTGYQVLTSGARTIDVADPFYPDSTNDYDSFPSYYHGGGVWTASFLTKK